MSESIKDGKGSSNLAHVDLKHRLHVAADTLSYTVISVLEGNHYNIGTPAILFNDEFESALLYVKNDSELDFFIDKIVIHIGITKGGQANHMILRRHNTPIDGTLLSNSLPALVFNHNYSSIEVFKGTTLSGIEGDTFIGASQITEYLIPSDEAIYNVKANINIGNNKAIGFSFIPPANNSELVVQLHIEGCYINKDIINE